MVVLRDGVCSGCPIDFSKAPGIVIWEMEGNMTRWLTIRFEDGHADAKACGGETFTDSEDGKHTVNESVPVKLSKEVIDGLKQCLKDAEPDIKKALGRSVARTQVVVADMIDNRGVLEKAAGTAKKFFRGGVSTKGERK